MASPTAHEIERWMVRRLCAELELEPGEIDVSDPVDRYGLDSRTAASISGELEDWLGRPLSPTLVWEYPTIAELAHHLTQPARAAEPSTLTGLTA